MRIDFVKMHGLGNDFIVFDVPAGASLPTVAQWRRLSNRHTGIGFDQALVLEPPRREGTSRLLSHLQLGWRRGRTVWQRRALYRRLRPSARPDSGRRDLHDG